VYRWSLFFFPPHARPGGNRDRSVSKPRSFRVSAAHQAFSSSVDVLTRWFFLPTALSPPPHLKCRSLPPEAAVFSALRGPHQLVRVNVLFFILQIHQKTPPHPPGRFPSPVPFRRSDGNRYKHAMIGGREGLFFLPRDFLVLSSIFCEKLSFS